MKNPSLISFLCLLLLSGCGGGSSSPSPDASASSNDENPVDAVEDTLPPDPGEAGKQTVKGIDSDNDGVRDDVQRSIVIAHPNDSQDQRNALLRFAATSQEQIVMGSLNEDPPQPESRNMMIAMESCLEAQFGRTGAHNRKQYIKSLMVNTPEREEAYKAYWRKRDDFVSFSMSFEEMAQLSDVGADCEF